MQAAARILMNMCLVAALSGCTAFGVRAPEAIVAETWMGDPMPGEIDSVATWRSVRPASRSARMWSTTSAGSTWGRPRLVGGAGA